MQASHQSKYSRSPYSIWQARDPFFIKHRGEYFSVGQWGGGVLSGAVTANYIGINGRRRLGTLILEEMTSSGRFVLGQVRYSCLLLAPDQTLLELITGETTTLEQAYAEIDDVFEPFITSHRLTLSKIPPAIRRSFGLS